MARETSTNTTPPKGFKVGDYHVKAGMKAGGHQKPNTKTHPPEIVRPAGQNVRVVRWVGDENGHTWVFGADSRYYNYRVLQWGRGTFPKPRPKPAPKPQPTGRRFPVIPSYGDKRENLPFKGKRTCICMATLLPWVEFAFLEAGVIRSNIDWFQHGYNQGGVNASAGTHDRGGVVDKGQHTNLCLKIERSLGLAGQRRTPAQGFDLHDHAFAIGCPHGSSGLRYQMSRWRAGRNGLVSDGRITGPGPIGKDTPTWTKALADYKRRVGAVKGATRMASLASFDDEIEIVTDFPIGIPGIPGVDREPVLPEADPAMFLDVFDVVAAELSLRLDEVPDDLDMPDNYDDGHSDETAEANTDWTDPEDDE